MRTYLSFMAALLSATSLVEGLQVTPGSSCQPLCRAEGMKSVPTNTSEIVCKDDMFFDTGEGIKFKNCISCLQDSTETSGTKTDVHAYLHNLRFAFDVCLYSYPGTPESGFLNTPCNIGSSCGGLSDALQTSLLEHEGGSTYDYCEGSESLGNEKLYRNCIKCLQATPNQKYFANFLVALKAGCQQRPKPGGLVSTSGSLFTDEWTTILNPEDDIRNKPKGAGATTLTTGAIVGIGAGCALLIVGVCALIFVHCRRRRNNVHEKMDSPYPDTFGSPGIIRTTRGGDGGGDGGGSVPSSKYQMAESISSHGAHRDSNHGHIASTHNDGSRDQTVGLNYHYVPSSKSNGPLGALPTHAAYIPRVMSRASKRDQPPPPDSGGKSDHSYPLRTYSNDDGSSSNSVASDPSRPLAAHHAHSFSQPGRPPSPPRPAAIAGTLPPPAPHVPLKPKAKIPSLVLPSLSRARASKTYRPPRLTGSKGGIDNGEHAYEISRPLAVSGTRFEDRPLAGGSVLTTDLPKGFANLKPKDMPESPLRTGDSALLYG